MDTKDLLYFACAIIVIQLLIILKYDYKINKQNKLKMKNILLIAIVGLLISSCSTGSEQLKVNKEPPKQTTWKIDKYKDVVYYKVIKDLKEIQEQHTSSKTKVNWAQTVWNGDLKTTVIPNVYTETKYYVIYTDKTHDEVSRDTWLSYSKGDSIKKVTKVLIN